VQERLDSFFDILVALLSILDTYVTVVRENDRGIKSQKE